MYITWDNYIQMGLLIVSIISVVISIMNYIKNNRPSDQLGGYL